MSRPPKVFKVGDLILTIKEAADLLNLKDDTLRKRLRRGSNLRMEFEKKDYQLIVKNSHGT